MKPSSETKRQQTDEISKIRRYGLICALLWTVMISGLFFAYVADNSQAVHEIGHHMAQAAFDKDVIFRRWGARHGGVYVPETAETPANPYLSHIPERDITTPSGKRLTLINPAYMTRQIFEMSRELPDNAQGHITSLNPVRPENAPDAWETKALKELEKGAKEVFEPVMINGREHLRLMRPLLTEKPCLKCHAQQGYKEGDGRGGISVTLSLAPISKAMREEMRQEALIHSITWLVGLGLIWLGTRKISQTMRLLLNERNSLCESEERFRALHNATFGGVIIHDKGLILECNQGLSDMTGFSMEELIGMDGLKLIAPDWLDLVLKNIQTGFEQRYEVEGLRKDGSKYPLAIKGKNIPYKGNSARVIEFRDITERKLVEANLAESESHLRTIIDNEPECIKIIDTDGRLVEMNPAGLKMVEADTIEQVAGHPVLEFIALEYREAYSELHNRVITGETVQMKYEVLGLNGRRRWVETNAVPMHTRGRLVHLAVTRDISEQKRAEDERVQIEQQFHHSQKLESLGVLAGGVAHDFNNILTIIIGHCYMAREELKTEQEFKTSFAQIESASLRAANLCRQMLTYAGRVESVQTRFSLWLLVEEVVKMLQATIKKNINIELDLDHSVPDINGDIGQIQQIAMNLIINAAEAIGDANGTVRVVLKKTDIQNAQGLTDEFGTVIKAGSYACMEIADNGCGMDKETSKRIFEPFFSTKFAGRGLGMSAIRGIIKSQEGILQMSSTPGVGTTFRVCLPLSELSDIVKNVPFKTVSDPVIAGNILLVDDEVILRDMGRSLLDALGFSAITAQDGKEALEIFQEHGSEIDLILLDLIMPVMGGAETYRELRRISTSVPIIICSGYGVESAADIIGDDPNADFVKKPYKPESLREIMIKMMGQRTKTSEAI